MCRNIKPLYHFDPPASPAEIQAAALQYVRKISGFHQPSQINVAAFEAAVEAISVASAVLLEALDSNAPLKNRAAEAAKAQARAKKRFA